MIPASRACRSDSGSSLVSRSAVSDEPKESVIVYDDFAINRQQLPVTGDDQRIDLGQFRVAFDITLVEAAQDFAEAAPLRPWHAHSAGDEGHLIILQAHYRINMLADDGFGAFAIELLNIHAAFH